ncbi:UNVERIFIED_CONTAM: hypothetical protein GTU68_015717 [Idotea baltica]|nr:hypothetical protein [Idotea baltica]
MLIGADRADARGRSCTTWKHRPIKTTRRSSKSMSIATVNLLKDTKSPAFQR